MNIYQLVGEELARTHELLKICLQTEATKEPRVVYGSNYVVGLEAGTIWTRLLGLQDTLMKALAERDVVIQDKIAELALTGKDETNGK